MTRCAENIHLDSCWLEEEEERKNYLEANEKNILCQNLSF